MYTRILVPLDGSPLAEIALADATMLARAIDVPLFLLRIVDYTRLESYGPYGLAMEYASIEPVLSTEAWVSARRARSPALPAASSMPSISGR